MHSWNPKQPFIDGCLGETAIFYIKIWNHPIETTIYTWLFGVPGCQIDFSSVKGHIEVRTFHDDDMVFIIWLNSRRAISEHDPLNCLATSLYKRDLNIKGLWTTVRLRISVSEHDNVDMFQQQPTVSPCCHCSFQQNLSKFTKCKVLFVQHTTCETQDRHVQALC